MSDPEVVVRLLAAIDEREATAREATRWSAPEWSTASSAVLDLGVDDLDSLIPVPASPISHHMEANDPASVLRLCQSHRDIVAMYQQQKQIAEQLEFEQRDSDAHMTAVAIVLGLASAVTLLARGYGIEEETTDDE